jgi:hypothetical protein
VIVDNLKKYFFRIVNKVVALSFLPHQEISKYNYTHYQ